MSQSPVPIVIDLTQSFGSMIVGAFLSCAMWGVSSLQVFLYFAMYEMDHWSLKLLVAFLWVIDTANQMVVLSALWPVLVQSWGDVTLLAKIQPGLIHHAWIAQLLEFSVQMYFIRRIYIFSGKQKILPAIMAILSIFQLVILIPYDIYIYSGGAASAHLATHKATSMVIALRAVTAGEDIILAATLMYLVMREGIPDFHKTRRLVIRLLVVTANTGLWTAIIAFIELMLVASYPSGLQFTIVEFPLCSLYFSSLLASLNARQFVRGVDSTVINDSMMPSTDRSGVYRGHGNALYLKDLGSGRTSESTRKVTNDEETIGTPGDLFISVTQESKTHRAF